MATRIRIRRGYSTEWVNANPVLLLGELGYEIDSRRIKAGDGTTPWTSLDYTAGQEATNIIWGDIAGTLSNQTDLMAVLNLSLIHI